MLFSSHFGELYGASSCESDLYIKQQVSGLLPKALLSNWPCTDAVLQCLVKSHNEICSYFTLTVADKQCRNLWQAKVQLAWSSAWYIKALSAQGNYNAELGWYTYVVATTGDELEQWLEAVKDGGSMLGLPCITTQSTLLAE